MSLFRLEEAVGPEAGEPGVAKQIGGVEIEESIQECNYVSVQSSLFHGPSLQAAAAAQQPPSPSSNPYRSGVIEKRGGINESKAHVKKRSVAQALHRTSTISQLRVNDEAQEALDRLRTGGRERDDSRDKERNVLMGMQPTVPSLASKHGYNLSIKEIEEVQGGGMSKEGRSHSGADATASCNPFKVYESENGVNEE